MKTKNQNHSPSEKVGVDQPSNPQLIKGHEDTEPEDIKLVIGSPLKKSTSGSGKSNSNHSQRKKDIDEVQNVSIFGDTKNEQGKTINTEHIPVNSDNHADTSEKSQGSLK